MVEEGRAWHFKRYSRDKKLAAAEEAARAAKAGLWRDPNPIPPWEFRRNPSPAKKKSATTAGDPTVYITASGTKYHRADCRYVRKGSSPIPLSRAKAGYERCSVCKPP